MDNDLWLALHLTKLAFILFKSHSTAKPYPVSFFSTCNFMIADCRFSHTPVDICLCVREFNKFFLLLFSLLLIFFVYSVIGAFLDGDVSGNFVHFV